MTLPHVLHGVLSSDCQDEARRQQEQSGLAFSSLQGVQRAAGPVWSDTERLASKLVLLPRLQVDPRLLTSMDCTLLICKNETFGLEYNGPFQLQF